MTLSSSARTRGKEGRWRQLHFVANYDHLMRAINRRDGFFDWNLAGFVEDDNVEEVRVERQGVGNAEGTHQPDGFQIAG